MPVAIPVGAGERFGFWNVRGWNRQDTRAGRFYWVECHGCDARTVRSVSGVELRKGRSTSCGCQIAKAVAAAAKDRGYRNLSGDVIGLVRIDGLASGTTRRDRRWRATCLGGGPDCAGFAIKSEAELLRRPDNMSCGCLARRRQIESIQYPWVIKVVMEGLLREYFEWQVEWDYDNGRPWPTPRFTGSDAGVLHSLSASVQSAIARECLAA